MNAKVKDLMTASVITARSNATVDRARKLMKNNGIGTVPVVDSEGQPVGIVSTTDLVPELKPNSPLRNLMTSKVYTVPQYDDVSVAARIMRNHHIHHLVVTHEKEVVGILSSFDLLKLVEDHRFVAKNAPTPSKRKGSRKR